jgi:hypothetical protein
VTDVPKNATGALAIRSMDDLARVGQMLAQSGYFTDAKDAAQCGVKVLAGLEMGFGAFASMSGLHIIQGRPTIGANLMAARVKNSGRYDYRVRELTPTVCRLEFFENGESLGMSEFTIEDARKAQTKNLDKFARNMLFARSMSNGVRWYCPDVFLGATVYTPEELGAATDEDGNIIDVPSRPERVVERPALAAPMVEAPRAAEVAPWAPEEPDEPFATMITPAQLKKLAIVVKEQGLGRDDALGFFAWLIKRPIESSKDITKDEASRVLSWTADQWGNALADYAVSLEGGPPDVSDLGAVAEERPIEFDPTGSVARQARKGAAA